MRVQSTTRRRIGRSILALVLSAFVVMAGSTFAFAEEPGFVSLKKTASTDNVVPGETFTYTLEVGCTSFGAGCTNATITDAIPPEFKIIGDPHIGVGLEGEAQVHGQDVSIVFTHALADPEGSVGLPSAATGTVTITVQVDPDLPYSADGVPITNTATFAGTNTDSKDSTAGVTVTVPLDLNVAATKSIEPQGAPAVPGTELTATLSGTNTSNASVDSISLTDPADPTLQPNPFEHLGFTGFGTVTFPQGADQVLVQVWNGTTWVSGVAGPTVVLPAGVDAGDVYGVQLTFSNSTGGQLAPEAKAEVALSLVQRDTVEELAAPLTVANTVVAGAILGAETKESDLASDEYVITPSSLEVAATKVFTPDQVLAGDSSLVTVTSTNTGTPVETMTITEPNPGSENPFENGLTFTGFGTDSAGNGVVWPNGATAAHVTFTFDDGTTETIEATGPNTLPNPPNGKVVIALSTTFTGTMVTGAEATIPFTVDTEPDQVGEERAHGNEIFVEVDHDGQAVANTADDVLTTFTERLAVAVEKKISPDRIPSAPGEITTVQLPSQLLPFPDSTADAEHIVVQDPRVVPPVPSPDPWWNSFDARSISQTAIPAGATLTIRYWDGTDWVILPGGENLAGPQIVNLPIPSELKDSIQGLQFDYRNPEGFPPGTSVQPYFAAELREDLRDNTGPGAGPAAIIENCAAASATATGATGAGETAQPCPAIELVPDTPGVADLIEKDFVEPLPGAGKTVIARSGDHIDAQLSWSTGGHSGFDQVIVTDAADPETTPIADSVFNAFTVVAVPAISNEQDPLLKYDAVARVELWNGSAWVDAENDPCPTLCDARFPGFTVTSDEQEFTTGVRLIFVESPSRATVTDPTAPQPGDGVARSFELDRTISLTFALRDEVRDPQATPDPVIGTREYNVADAPGEVRNTARASGYVDGERTYTDVDDDIVSIIDVPLNVNITKAWSGGPLGIPPAGTAPDAFPSGRVSIGVTNATAANVDTVTITEPATSDPADDPFNIFDIKDIVTISVPTGATSATVTLRHTDGSSTVHSREQALEMTSTQLADVVGIAVDFTGRIASGARGTLVFDTRLRATHRVTHIPVTVADSPVSNTALASVEDLGGTAQDSPTDEDSASIVLEPQGISIATAKTFSPSELVEPAKGPVTMTLSGTPGGASRTNRMVLTDDEPTFWNQYSLIDFAPSFALTAPITRVQVDAFVGGTYSAGPSGVSVSGGSWIDGTPSTAANIALPAGVMPADVQGLRFSFTRADGSIWENPDSPIQKVPLQVERRDDLLTGGPVLSDLAGNLPAPGETVPGTANNTVHGLVEGADMVGGQPISATGNASASIVYKHATNAVSVVKKANGAVAGGLQIPDKDFPYTLEITNTGDVPIKDPTIIDRLPTDAQGAQLVFNSDLPSSEEGAFSYELSGPAPDPANGPALPTDPSQVVAHVQGAVEQISFTFPAGSVLEVGQTYSITITLRIRPGLAGSTLVDNTFGVVADRPWDQCEGEFDQESMECRASSSVTVAKSGALRAAKSVRAVDDELGNIVNSGTGNSVPSGPGSCVPGPNGFYVSPCVPVTKPGGEEIWRLNYTNTGNLPMTEVLAVDRLPDVGDTGAGNPLPRGSQWRPIFEGTISVKNAPAGAQVNYMWSNEKSPCIAGPAGCPPGSWTFFPESGGPAFTPEILASVTGILVDVRFSDPLFNPLDAIAFDITTTTPAISPTPGPDPIAWNSAGATGVTLDEGVSSVIPATEGNKVGVAMATGPISMVKHVTGEGAKYAPESFPVQVQCISAVGTRFEAAVPLGASGEVVLEKDVPQTVVDIPWGSECTVVEDNVATRPSDFEANTQTVGRDSQGPATITAVNRYDLAALLVSKSVHSDAVNEENLPIDYGPFTFTVECTFLDERVYADGYSASTPMSFQLADKEEKTLQGLPSGAFCEITETDAKGAVSSNVTTRSGSSDPVTIDGLTAGLELASRVPNQELNTAVFENSYAVGALHIVKTIDGAGSELYGAGPFRIALSCTLSDETGTRPVFEGTVQLGGGDPLETTVTQVATGAVCDITEPQSAGATSTTITPPEITVGTDMTAEIAVTNTFDLGSLIVNKVVNGAGAEYFGKGPFEVELECRLPGAQDPVIEIPGGPVRQFSPENPARYDNLPVGAICHVRETVNGGATSSILTGGTGRNPLPIEIGAGAAVERTFTNTFDVGEVRVIKRLAGPGANRHQGDTFTFQLSCTLGVGATRERIEIPGGDTRTASAATGWVATFTGLPQGADCEITETTLHGADQVHVVIGGQSSEINPSAPSVSPPTMTLPETSGSCEAVEVINIWNGASGAKSARANTVESTDTHQLRMEVGCDPYETQTARSAKAEELPLTGTEILGLAALGALLTAGGYVAIRQVKRSRQR